MFLSYSFGSVANLGRAEKVFPSAPIKGDDGDVIMGVKTPVCKKVFASSTGPSNYQPEIQYCAFLDAKYPDDAPHFMYACYARDWTPRTLSALYKQVKKREKIVFFTWVSQDCRFAQRRHAVDD